MKNKVYKLLAILLVLALFGCGAQPAATTASPAETTAAPVERTGLSFEQDAVWRATKTVLVMPNTIELWVKLDKGDTDVLLSTAGNGDPSLALTVDKKGAPTLEWVVDCYGEGVMPCRFSKVDLRTGNWEHLAIVRDDEAGKLLCYVNGEEKDSISARITQEVLPARPYCIGGDHTPKNENSCSGQIGSVAVFSTARTQEQIKADMVKPEGEGLLACYDLSAVSGETVKDLSSFGNDLIRSIRWFAEKEPVTDYAYSMVVIGDTQTVAKGSPELFPKITRYIADNAEAKNIQFVMGMGDITNDSTESEWTAAQKSYELLDGVVPYSVARGHEGHDKAADFFTYFPYSKYAGQISGTMGDMCNVYYNFEVGEVKYLVMVLDASPDDKEVAWANEVIAKHPDRNVILTTHEYLYRDGTPMGVNDLYPIDHNNGDDLWEKLVRKHANISLVLCGHDPCSQVVVSQTEGDNGNIVTQMLVDGQSVDSTDGRCGLVAILYFSEDGKNVTVEYYSTIREEYFLTENQFSFTLDTVD